MVYTQIIQPCKGWHDNIHSASGYITLYDSLLLPHMSYTI